LAHSRFFGVAFFLACVSTATARGERLYSVTPVPAGPFSSVGGNALNDAGHAVGIASGPFSGYYWSPETGVVSLGPGVVPLGLNNHDVVAGRDASNAAFTWDPQSRTFQPVPGGTMATDINDAGQVVYRTENAGLVLGSFIRDPGGTARPLAAPVGGTRVAGGRLNAQGEVVGNAFFADDGQNRAVYWSAAGDVRRLPDLPGVSSSDAADINALGIVVGQGGTDPGTPDPLRSRALLWDVAGGSVRDLGTLPGDPGARANAINDAGEVVGGSGTNPGDANTRPFLWTAAEGMLDLSTLLDASGQGWTLHSPTAINNRGQILVTGVYNGASAGAILTPVPEPTALTAAIVPLAASGLLRRRRHPGSRC
jgi:probable HAF family extracellular repeat protein